ncbi:MAG: GTP 3',8-cyclase MoaA [Desulfamplus sp.]|nr:GTP 3',8-cyclase MoaA [Desulfamplus sp.]
MTIFNENKPVENQLVDLFKRKVEYLRLSVTDRCNLNCRYCAPSMPKPIQIDKLLTFEEMYRVVKIGVKLGIQKVRLTGGEPLFRNGVVDFVEKLCEIEELKEVSLTTNGTLLAEKALRLKAAGMNRINISLDTLSREKFRELTGADKFNQVWNGIMKSAEAGFSPVKINTVVMGGFNDSEVPALANLTLKYPFHVRFIEYMPIGVDPKTASDSFIPSMELKSRLEDVCGKLIPVQDKKLDGPAKRYRFENAQGEIGFISSMSQHFCESCNRMRMTARGFLRPCLLSEEQVDVITKLREGASDEEIEALFRQALALKNSRHGLTFMGEKILKTKMVSIGG